jgi:hypothetical protein
MGYTIDELRREQMEWDALQDRIAEDLEKQQQRIDWIKEAIVDFMDQITEEKGRICSFDEYMDELTFYFDNSEHEDYPDRVEARLQDLIEMENEE